MIEIKVCVTNPREKENAEYVRDHFECFANGLNGCYLTIFEGPTGDIDTPASIAYEPSVSVIWNAIFNNQ